MANRDDNRPEPEIIPPDRTRDWPPRRQSRVHVSFKSGDGRTYTPGPFTAVLAIVAVILIAAVILMLVLGALLIWVPLVALFAAGALVAAFLRGYFRRPR